MLTLYESHVPTFRPWFLPRRDTYWAGFSPESFDSISRFPRAEMLREDGHYRLTAEVPGMRKEDVKVEVKDGVLTITIPMAEEKSRRIEVKAA